MLVALGHIVGSIVATTILAILVLVIGSWESQRIAKRRLEEAALKFGVSVSDLSREELFPRLIEFSSQRFSSELMRNRFSDLCGMAIVAWDVLGVLAQLCVLVGVIWLTVSDSPALAVFAWSVPAIGVFFILTRVAFAMTCHLLTGRYPGEARQGRKGIVEYLKQRSA